MTLKCTGLVIALTFLVTCTMSARAQETKDPVGIELYKKGEFANAVSKLKASDDYIDLYYLGLAYEKLNQKKDAGKAFDASFRRGYQIIENEIRGSITLPGEKSTVGKPLSALLEGIAPNIAITLDSAQKAFALKAPVSKENEWIMKGRFLYELNGLIKRGGLAYSLEESDIHVKITARPRPNYTDAARGGNTQGTVVLLVIFSENGTVAAAAPLKPLANGLTEQAYMSAQKIVFTPAMKNGKTITTLMPIEL